MRPAVVTAVLLLVCVLDTVTARVRKPRSVCGRYPDVPCGDGWSRIDANRCAKFIESPKTFHDAQEHCRTLNADLVSVHSLDQMLRLYCLISRADAELQDIWSGAIRSEGVLRYVDGSEFKYGQWFPSEATNSDGQEECFNVNFSGQGHNVAQCSEENHFVCAKEM